MSSFLLGIDIGTSACKTALFRADGSVAAESSVEYPVFYPQAGWAEQNPETWWEAVCSAVKNMISQSQIQPSSIEGVGIDGQSWSAVALSASGDVLCNTPIWMDTRSAGICAELRDSIGEKAIFDVCGNPLQPTYSLPKILWYKKYLPEVYKKTDKILQSNSYIAYRMTGEITQDVSQGYGFQCFNIKTGTWNEELCKEMGLRRDLLPEIFPCHQIIGKVTAEAAAQCGLAENTPVVAGGLDAACGTLGAGVIKDGETQEQGGQSGGMSICMDKCLADPNLILCSHVVPEHWLLQGGTVGGGGVVRWFEQQFGAEERSAALAKGTGVFKEMDAAAETISAGSDGLIFLPYMAGERSPIWNPNAKGVYYGLDFSKTRGHMFRASMEGVAFSLRHNLMTAEKAGAKIGRLRAMGGSANSLLWTQMKSDITGKPIDVPSTDTATALGAAILAGVAVGVYRDFKDAVRQTIRIRRTHEPDNMYAEQYEAAFETYLAVYENLKTLMK